MGFINHFLITLILKNECTIILIIGIIGTVLFDIQAIQDSERFNFLGIYIGVSSADWTPLIVSVVILVVYAILMLKERRKGIYHYSLFYLLDKSIIVRYQRAIIYIDVRF